MAVVKDKRLCHIVMNLIFRLVGIEQASVIEMVAEEFCSCLQMNIVVGVGNRAG